MTDFTSYGPTGNRYVDGVLYGKKWTSAELKFSFPTDPSQYQGYPANSTEPQNGFGSFTEIQKQAVRAVLASYSEVTNLVFTEVTESATEFGNLRYAESDDPETAWAYYPGFSQSGDIWFSNSETYYDSPTVGSYGYATILHETGHALGLKHPHEKEGAFPTMPSDKDSLEYSVMSYRSYPGMSLRGNYVNALDSFPQSLMIYDIAALQFLYGPNYNTESGNTIYRFDPATGRMSINGVQQEQVDGNKIFRSIWDGGGIDTYDFSNYTGNQIINLEPGKWSTVSSAQLANLGGGRKAVGNIANALLFEGNTSALIENAIGGSGNDRITGNAAENILDGRAGGDTLAGGLGDDTYIVDSTADKVIEKASEGWDTIFTSLTSYSLVDAVSKSKQKVAAPSGLSNIEKLVYDNGDALDTNFIATGNKLDNKLTGGSGDDRLDGGSGVDRLEGFDGNDIYVIDHIYDAIWDSTGTSDVDVVFSSVSFDLSGSSVIGEIENLTLTGSAAIDGVGNELKNTILGNAGANFIIGAGGADNLDGGAGIDTLNYVDSLSGVTITLNGALDSIGSGGDAEGDVFRNFENIIGSVRSDSLTGDASANVIDGNGGGDFMAGGLGNDTYVVNSLNDIIIEGLNGGIDLVQARLSVTLSDNVENVVLLNEASLSAVGNSLANKLTGNAGDNLLDGGAGADIMTGSWGSDTYVVDAVADKVIELAGQGDDTIITSLSTFSLAGGGAATKKKPAPAGLPAIENLTYDNGVDPDANFTGTGNALANKITGGDGNDKLNGGAGADWLLGHHGDDTYIVDSLGDLVDETEGSGTDLVQSSVSFNLSNSLQALGNVENLTLTGTSAINATGNALDNVIIGNTGANQIEGLEGNDTLTGGNGSDRFVFNSEALSGDFGKDIITDFKGGTGLGDVIAIDDSWGFTAASLVAAFQIVGLDKVLTIDSDTSITLLGRATLTLNADDFAII